MSFCFAVDLSPMFPDTLMVGMEIRLKVERSFSSIETELSQSFSVITFVNVCQCTCCIMQQNFASLLNLTSQTRLTIERHRIEDL